MVGQISASNQFRTISELAPNMFGASSKLASVMEFGFNRSYERNLVFVRPPHSTRSSSLVTLSRPPNIVLVTMCTILSLESTLWFIPSASRSILLTHLTSHTPWPSFLCQFTTVTSCRTHILSPLELEIHSDHFHSSGLHLYTVTDSDRISCAQQCFFAFSTFYSRPRSR